MAAAATEADDPYLWLEATDDAKALDWVKARNAETVARYAATPSFAALRDRILEVMDSSGRIPLVQKHGDYYYNFWRDGQHPLGLWRRTTLVEYRKAHPRWDVVIDVDALAAVENEKWVWHGADCLRPDYRRCLVSLSRGGADAVVVREFDVKTRVFVSGGFTLPEAKSDVGWVDADNLYVATDFGQGSLTRSGYPRIVKSWRRGTPLSDATLVYEVGEDDLAAAAYRDHTPGFVRDFVVRQIAFYNTEKFLRTQGGALQRIEVPNDAIIQVHREWLTVQLRSAWSVEGTTYPAGALLATNFDHFMAGKRVLHILFTPSDSTSLDSYSWTRHHLIVNTMHDVVSRLEVLTPVAGKWKREPLGGAPALSTVSASSVDEEHSDAYFLSVSGFLEPATLYYGTLGTGHAAAIKHSPGFFDAAKYAVHQYFTTSKDGTRVPYFVIAARNLKLDGNNPAVLYGYGGFEISMQPRYSGTVGRAWLDKGGVFVVANIRGGGEYGPRWHLAALKGNRARAYEDFAAVAMDLTARRISAPAHLGAFGGSNGGLLVGNMLTQYPQLFGAIVCEVPLLDMKRYTHLAAGASWIAEYGDPDKPADWAYMRTFSPYQNVRAGEKYPPMLLTTSTRDDRVGPAQARKMAARMLQFGDDVSLYENIEGGHGGAADNKQAAFMAALAYTYLWQHLR
ncbi:MAG: prolyl oligopeptidase family serine peptidase [Casimicrobiaceae bacterium]